MTAADHREPRAVRVWDLPTRVFHWLLVALVASAWISFRYSEAFADYTLRWHRWNGYAVLVLLVWRVLWGLAGSSTSRFKTFVRWPWVAAGYAFALLRRREPHYLGHNPLGAWMVLALLAVVAAQAGLGLFTVEHNDSGAYGPLYRIVSEATWKQLSSWHRWNFYWIILPLVGVHVIANLLYQFVKRERLITAMITGAKPAAAYVDASEAALIGRPVPRALLCLALAAAIVFGGILALGGRLL